MKVNYVAYTLDEGILKGWIEARDIQEARTQIVEQGMKPLQVKKAFKAPGIETLLPSLFSVKVGELIAFSRQLSTMLASGANLLRALEMLLAESSNRTMRNVLASVYEKVSEGESFTGALRHHPDVFDEVYISLVEVGEYTGRLGPALTQVAEIFAQAHEAKKRAIKALTMPIFLVFMSVAMLGFMTFIALPPLLATFEQMNVEVPGITKLLISFVEGAQANFKQIAGGTVVLFILYKLFQRFPSTKYALDLVKIRMPLFGPLILAAELGRISRIMSTLLGAGVDLPSSLRLGLSSTKNELLRRAWVAGQESMMTGHRMAEALDKHSIVPHMVVELIAIGEESNTLPRTMGEVADAYQQEFEDRIAAILGVVEPASQVSVGVVVLIMMLSIMKPILSASEALQ